MSDIVNKDENATVNESDKDSTKSYEYALTGKHFRLRYLWIDIIALFLIYLAMRGLVFRISDEQIAAHPLIFWGTLLGSTFAFYMATVRIVVRELSITKQFLEVLSKHLDGNYDDMSSVAYELQTKGNTIVDNIKGLKGSTKADYGIDESGTKWLVILQKEQP